MLYQTSYLTVCFYVNTIVFLEAIENSVFYDQNIWLRGGSTILHEWFATTKLGGFGGMVPQANLKFSAHRMQFSCILRATQAIQRHKNM